MTPLQSFTADHQFLLRAAAEAAGIADPVAFDMDQFQHAVLSKSVRGPVVPIAGTLVRDWSRYWTKTSIGVEFGARLFTADGIRFVWVYARVHDHLAMDGYSFYAVARADYLKLFRFARASFDASHKIEPPPVLPDDLFATMKQNTLTFLDAGNLERIRALGGRPKRGLLFSGPPGNGKTSACRWILQQCYAEGLEVKQVTPDDYRAARHSCNPAAAVRELFTVAGRGVIFFDDMDIALRDRTDQERPEDQAVFLGAMDGIDARDGVVYVFTTNMGLDRIDPAFKRPGRLDLALNFPRPEADLRKRLVDRWHPDLRAAIDLERVVRETDGQSFAEIEEHKNLLVLRFVDSGEWSWDWARKQFERNREEALKEKPSPIGFVQPLIAKAPALALEKGEDIPF